MARFQPILATDPNLKITITVEPDDSPIDMQSGDPEYKGADDALERRIEQSARDGNEYAWCYVRVVATYTDPVTGNVSTGEDSLGGVSCLHDDARDMSAEQCFEELIGDEGYTMRANALDDLNKALERARQIRVVRACTTKYLGATDTKGSRVTAKHCTTGKRVTLSWDHALDSFENHAAVAERLLGARPDTYSSVGGGGYVFTVDPARCTDPNAIAD